MTELQGKWIWYELMTNDPAGAKAFYEAVVGWDITLGTEAPIHYGSIANDDGYMTGGLLPLTAEMTSHGARPAWLGYIGVDDCDATVTAIEAKGGKVLMAAVDLAEVGRFALVADPDGVPFYVMTPQMRQDTGGGSTAFDPRLLGRCAWNELQAGNQQDALDFYTSLFGWTLPEPMDMGPIGKYQFISHDDEAIGAIMAKMPLAPFPMWQYYFRVADIDVAAELTRANGGQVDHGPVEVPGGDWIINARDPQGVILGLVGAKSGAAQQPSS